MVYIRAKVVRGRTYYYLVKSIRDSGSVKQIVLKYLGKEKPSLEELNRIVSGLKKSTKDKEQIRKNFPS